jgi:hypothetical protein
MEAGQVPGRERGAPWRMEAVARVHEAAAAGCSDNVRHDVRHRIVHDGTHDHKNTIRAERACFSFFLSWISPYGLHSVRTVSDTSRSQQQHIQQRTKLVS